MTKQSLTVYGSCSRRPAVMGGLSRSLKELYLPTSILNESWARTIVESAQNQITLFQAILLVRILDPSFAFAILNHMKLLTEISEGSLGLNDQFEQLGSDYQLRKSARVILLNDDGKMATQYLKTYTYHKLPGGGIDAGESIEEALKREVKEEVGCDCEIIRPIGMTIEYRNKYKLLHISYCYEAKVVGEMGKPELEEGEIEEGHETLWLPPAEVLEKMKTDTPGKFEGHFILKREISFLEEYLK